MVNLGALFILVLLLNYLTTENQRGRINDIAYLVPHDGPYGVVITFHGQNLTSQFWQNSSGMNPDSLHICTFHSHIINEHLAIMNIEIVPGHSLFQSNTRQHRDVVA